MSLEDKMNYEYFIHFKEFWIPIYRKQILNAKYDNDNETLRAIYKNINDNWHLQDYKNYIFELLGISYLSDKVDIQPDIIEIYFKYKNRKELLYECRRTI